MIDRTDIENMNTIAFDTLAYVKKLRAAGEKEEVAEAHAEALRELMLDEIATKSDTDMLSREIARAREDLGKDITQVREDLSKDITQVREDLSKDITQVREDLSKDIAQVREDLSKDIAQVREDLSKDIAQVREDLSKDITQVRTEVSREIALVRKDIEAMENRMIIKMGAMVVGAVGLFALLVRLFDKL